MKKFSKCMIEEDFKNMKDMEETERMLKRYKSILKMNIFVISIFMILVFIAAIYFLITYPNIWWLSLIFFCMDILFFILLFFSVKSTKKLL